MSQPKILFSQHPVVITGMKQKISSLSDPGDASGSTSPHSSRDISSLLKSSCVIALSPRDVVGEAKFYAVRCLVAGVWGLQVQAGLQPYDPSVQLLVVNQNGKLGFRSAIAEGRLLCCNRQYHVGFERWRMDCQEAWTLQGNALSNCTLRNEMYRFTLDIRITVLAEPTDLLGNPRITSPLTTTTTFSGRLPGWTATTKSDSVSSSYVKEGLERKGGKSSSESPRHFLVKPGSNAKVSNPFTHQRKISNQPEVNCFPTRLFKTGAMGKPFLCSSSNRDESTETCIPRCGVFTFSSPVKTDSPQNSSLCTQGCTEQRKVDNHRVPLSNSAPDCNPRTPSRNESQPSSFSLTTRIFARERQSDTDLQERNCNHVSETVFSPEIASTSEIPRKIRKWKRNNVGHQRIFSVDFDGNNRPTCGLKRSQEPLFTDVVDEDDTLFSLPGSRAKGTSLRDGRHSPLVVIKRQPGFLASKVDLSPRTQQCKAKSKSSENSEEMCKYSASQLEAALNSLRKNTARQEKEIHWKLQAAVRLLRTETKHKLTLIAKGVGEEPDVGTFRADLKRNYWLSKDSTQGKRNVSSKLQQNLTPAAANVPSHQNKQPWTYPFKRVSAAKEEELLLAVSQKHISSFSRLQMLLKLWFFLPVPLLSLAYVTLIYRRKKAET